MMARLDQPLAWPVSLEPAEEGGFVVNFPDFPEGWSQGETREEALLQAADLLETMVGNYMAEGWDLPDPSPDAGGRPVVALAPLVAAKAELYRAMRERGSQRPNWRAASGFRRNKRSGFSASTTRRVSTGWRRRCAPSAAASS
jgi:predicted RNase H-like HicB family nuclease